MRVVYSAKEAKIRGYSTVAYRRTARRIARKKSRPSRPSRRRVINLTSRRSVVKEKHSLGEGRNNPRTLTR